MRALILGVGDAFTTRYFGSSALVEAPDGLVLIDCPDLVHRALREASEAAGWTVSADDVHDIVLTHLHGDHCNGLESFGFLRRIRRRERPDLPRPRLYASAAVAERVWERLAPAMDASMDHRPASRLEDYYDLRVLDADGATSVAGLSVRCRPTGHPIPTIGLLARDDHSTLGWSADTPYDAAHIQWLSEADLIVHECNRGPAHTAIESLNALPDQLRRRMRLIHYTDDFDQSSTDIATLHEGEVVEVARDAAE